MAGPSDPEDLTTTLDATRIVGLSPDMVRLSSRQERLSASILTARDVGLVRRADVDRLAAERAEHALECHERPPVERRRP